LTHRQANKEEAYAPDADRRRLPCDRAPSCRDRLKYGHFACPRQGAQVSSIDLGPTQRQQRPIGEKIVKISSVGLGGPYNPMLRSPVYAQHMYDLLDYLRWHTSRWPAPRNDEKGRR
jgi:hypothetical protein